MTLVDGKLSPVYGVAAIFEFVLILASIYMLLKLIGWKWNSIQPQLKKYAVFTVKTRITDKYEVQPVLHWIEAASAEEAEQEVWDAHYKTREILQWQNMKVFASEIKI